MLIVLHAAAFVWVHQFPFLGDTIPSNLCAAENIYHQKFTTFFNTPTADPGHPTLYPSVIALLWAIFGKTLWVTHGAQVIIGFALCLFVYKITNFYWTEKTAQFAALFFSISPLYVAQLTGASLQLPLTLAACAAFSFWQQNKKTYYAIALILLVLIHLQGSFLLLFLAVNDFVHYTFEKGLRALPQWVKKNWGLYALPFGAFITWGVLHHLHFGWAFSSPNYLRQMPSLAQVLYNFAIAFWRIIDFGYILPLASIVYYFFRTNKQLNWGNTFMQVLLSYALLVLVACGGICVLFAYPPIHRYFLPTTVLLFALFAGVLQGLPIITGKVLAIVAGIALIAGNFMYYPGKCIGDANIAYLPIYELEQQVQNELNDSIELYTYAPLSYPSSIRYLDEAKGLKLHGLYNKNIDSISYVLQSNMNCEFDNNTLEKLKHWHGTSFENGAVYINIYANPAYVPIKPKGWQLRQPIGAELWLLNLKKKLN